jgi:hypothetical protein
LSVIRKWVLAAPLQLARQPRPAECSNVNVKQRKAALETSQKAQLPKTLKPANA